MLKRIAKAELGNIDNIVQVDLYYHSFKTEKSKYYKIIVTISSIFGLPTQTNYFGPYSDYWKAYEKYEDVCWEYICRGFKLSSEEKVKKEEKEDKLELRKVCIGEL